MKKSPALVVDAGGVAISVAGLSARLHRAAVARYGSFLAGGATPALTLAVRATRTRHAPDATPEIERVGARQFHLRYGGLTAELDLDAQRGHATIPASVHVLDSLLRMSATLLLLDRSALLLHASGVVWRGRALVCFGPSGVGKTTVARSVAPEDVLCDEVIALSVDAAGQVTASGTPFHGELDVCRPGHAPLGALASLAQETTDRVVPLSGAQAVRALLRSTLFFSRDVELGARLLALAVRIATGRTLMVAFRKGTHVPTLVEGSGAPAPARAALAAASTRR